MKNKNRVEYITHMGNDNLHALSAWASTFYDLDLEMPEEENMRVDHIVEYIISKSARMRNVEDLLKYLAENEHESPFRMSAFVFGMTTEIATHIQKLKHAVILEAENGESAKYKELKEDKFYLPKDWLDYGDVGKKWYETLKNDTEHMNRQYHQCYKELKEAGMPLKRVKESSRFFKTYNSQINTINKFSFAGVMILHKKRTVDFAQEEIKEVANEMVDIIRNLNGNPFKYSLKAFGLDK